MRVIILLAFSLLIAGCSGESSSPQKQKPVVEEKTCLDLGCEAGNLCDAVTGNCEAIPGYCTGKSDCPDGVQRRKCDLSINRCIDDTACYGDNECHGWEACELESGLCIPREHRCNSDDDCSDEFHLKKCDTATHNCAHPDSCIFHPCETWQYCSDQGGCVLKAGYCTDHEHCVEQFPFTICNEDTHLCEAPVVRCEDYRNCENWEYCDPDQGICRVNSGRCTSFLDCSDGMVCDLEDHTCKMAAETHCSKTGCAGWEQCDQATGVCSLLSGRCGDDHDCTEINSYCDPGHTCRRDDCTTNGCSFWEDCDEESGVCNPYNGMCNSDTDCAGTLYTDCNLLLHTCQKSDDVECVSDFYCENWEICDLNTKSCVLEPGKCVSNEDCYSLGNRYQCDTGSHQCVDQGCLIDGCYSWERCDSDTRQCVLNSGACNTRSDCGGGYTCNDDHQCEEVIILECNSGETLGCYSGDPYTQNRGICREGVYHCGDDGYWLSSCDGEVLPGVEICDNNLDDNCNGVTDEGCGNDTHFLVFESETATNSGYRWVFRNINTNTTITISGEGFASGEYSEMKTALIYAFTYLSSADFRVTVSAKTDWTYIEKTGPQIYEQYLGYINQNQSFPVIAYKTTWPWSSVSGYAQGGKIYLNTRHTWSEPYYGKTISHEMFHLAGFSHGSNTYTDDKADSVPYFVGGKVKDYIEEQ